MRDFSEFCSQLNEMRARFHSWDSCERTVALYYLMVGLPFANARFLQNTLERCIAAVITPEAQVKKRVENRRVFQWPVSMTAVTYVSVTVTMTDT